ncbi:hypothetical protein [Okeania sp.]|uniref:hypothetical protein n=1 Tax=Okeania sp. TaxID=3100323 RepID=UPI002B4B2C19|nr:hypothetical protein [Okeania sp.]MEB3343288.1 hypothetical protein [Okeania sp.]
MKISSLDLPTPNLKLLTDKGDFLGLDFSGTLKVPGLGFPKNQLFVVKKLVWVRTSLGKKILPYSQ